MITKIRKFFQRRTEAKKRFNLLHTQLQHVNSHESFAVYVQLRSIVLQPEDHDTLMDHDLWLAEEVVKFTLDHPHYPPSVITRTELTKNLKP